MSCYEYRTRYSHDPQFRTKEYINYLVFKSPLKHQLFENDIKEVLIISHNCVWKYKKKCEGGGEAKYIEPMLYMFCSVYMPGS